MDPMNTIPNSPAVNYNQMNQMHTYQTHVYQNDQNQPPIQNIHLQQQQQQIGSDLDPNDLGQILKILQKYNLKVKKLEVFLIN